MSKVVHAVSLALGIDESTVVDQAGLTVLGAESVKAALDVDWDDESAQSEALNRLLSEVSALEGWVAKKTKKKPAPPALTDALDLLRKVVDQDTEPDPPRKGRRIKQGVPPDRIVNTERDPDPSRLAEPVVIRPLKGCASRCHEIDAVGASHGPNLGIVANFVGTVLAVSANVSAKGTVWSAICFAVCVAACASEEVCQFESSLSVTLPSSFDEKAALEGVWEHTAMLAAPGGTTARAGTTTAPIAVLLRFDEDFLWMEDVAPEEPELVLAFSIATHGTIGEWSSGERCVANDDRPWYERTHARIGWWEELVASQRVLPVDAGGLVVEPLWLDHGSLESGELWPRYEYDRLDRLVGLRVKVRYYVECDGCDPGPIDVVHRFER